MSKVSLISIDNLSQLIPAMAALRQQLAHCELLEDQPLYIFIKPHIHLNTEAYTLLQRFCAAMKNTIIINGSALFKNNRLLLKIPARLRAKLLSVHLKKYAINQILFAHDCSSDFWNQTLMHTFPDAERICYGDALGLVYSQDYFTQLMFPIYTNRRLLYMNILSRVKRRLLLPTRKRRFYPSKLTLAIPCDPGQDVLNHYPMDLVKKAYLEEVISCFSAVLPEITTATKKLMADDEHPVLLTLSNFTESKLTTIENEISLYRVILQQHAYKESPIILKPHPAADPKLFNRIVQELGQDFHIRVIDNSLVHLPIELLKPLVLACKVISVSYSSISLPYLYNTEVIHALTSELILQYFQKEKIEWFMESNNLYLDMKKALKYWDQQGPLRLNELDQ